MEKAKGMTAACLNGTAYFTPGGYGKATTPTKQCESCGLTVPLSKYMALLHRVAGRGGDNGNSFTPSKWQKFCQTLHILVGLRG